MHKSAILEFLDLSPSATDEDIKQRAQEKKQFFLQLQANAPNAVLKTLHTRNIEKIEEILNTLGGSNAVPPKLKSYSFISSTPSVDQPVSSQAAIAWLVRHTEMMPTKSFPLYIGKNAIGRDQQSFSTIILDNDPYVSRQHAIVEVRKTSHIEVFISDGIHGKPSKNGIYLNSNEIRINKTTAIRQNDTIQIGNTKLILKLPDNNISISAIEKEVDESDYMKTVIINIF